MARENSGTAEVKTPLTSHRRPLDLVNVVVLVASLVGLAVITFHLLSDYIDQNPSESIGLIVYLSIAAVTMLVLAAVLPPAVKRIVRSDFNSTWQMGKTPKDVIKQARGYSELPGDATRKLCKLIRNAERLNAVEQELVRRISKRETDEPTVRLIAELQICTNRILKQLEEFEAEETDTTGQSTSESVAL